MIRDTLERLILDLQDAKIPQLTADDFTCFSPEFLAGRAHVSPLYLDVIAHSLSSADIPTFERAIGAIDRGEQAWIGFKVVWDGLRAQKNSDNAVTKSYGEVGSADGDPLVFFCNDKKELCSSRPYSPRDRFQMLDATRGPSMHDEQFEGLTWLSIPLFHEVRLWLLGASQVACELAPLAAHVGFRVHVLDCDPAYIQKDRFPQAHCTVLPNDNFSGIEGLYCAPEDYVCVLTRGHMFDPEGCRWALRSKAHYVGLMGCVQKNDRVFSLLAESGIRQDEIDRIKRPIGLRFGAKTPAELAIAIVAELIDVRYQSRYDASARALHEQNLGYGHKVRS